MSTATFFGHRIVLTQICCWHHPLIFCAFPTESRIPVLTPCCAFNIHSFLFHFISVSHLKHFLGKSFVGVYHCGKRRRLVLCRLGAAAIEKPLAEDAIESDHGGP